MFGFIGFILIFVLFLALFVISIALNLIKNILGFGGRSKKTSDKQNKNENYYHNKRKNKIIDKSEGEYVDFEELE